MMKKQVPSLLIRSIFLFTLLFLTGHFGPLAAAAFGAETSFFLEDVLSRF